MKSKDIIKIIQKYGLEDFDLDFVFTDKGCSNELPNTKNRSINVACDIGHFNTKVGIFVEKKNNF